METTETNKTNWLRIAFYVSVAVLFFAAVFSISQCEKERDRGNRLERNVDILKHDSIKKENIIGVMTNTQRALEVDKAELKNQIFIKDQKQQELLARFSKVYSATKISGDVIVSNIPFEIHVPVPCEDFTAPAVAKDTAGWYDIKMHVSVKDKKLTPIIDTIHIPLEIYHNIGYIKKGLFQKDELSSQVTVTNPNVVINKITTQVTTTDVPWYKKWWLWLTVGGGSVAILNMLLK